MMMMWLRLIGQRDWDLSKAPRKAFQTQEGFDPELASSICSVHSMLQQCFNWLLLRIQKCLPTEFLKAMFREGHCIKSWEWSLAKTPRLDALGKVISQTALLKCKRFIIAAVGGCTRVIIWTYLCDWMGKVRYLAMVWSQLTIMLNRSRSGSGLDAWMGEHTACCLGWYHGKRHGKNGIKKEIG